MKVRITRQPSGVVDGISLNSYRLGDAYDVHPLIGQYLVAEGYAVVEMRSWERSSRPRVHERRSRRPFPDNFPSHHAGQ